MKNLNELLKYTSKKKDFQISKLERHYSNSIKEISEYLNNQENAIAVTSGFNYLSIWYHWNFIDNFIKTGDVDMDTLGCSTIYAIESNNCEYFIGQKIHTYDESVQFHKAIKHMAQALLLGWDDLAIKYGNLLIKMLYGKQYKGGHPAYKHPWFMLELFCKWQKIELDYSKLNYPKDMSVYAPALKYWDTDDAELLSRLVNNLSEFHIAQSDEDEYENRTPDFPSSDYFIYAVEILLWLNIRERMGLPDYTPDNELMKLSINNWHTQNTEMPKIELIEKAKQKLMQDYPDISFEI